MILQSYLHADPWALTISHFQNARTKDLRDTASSSTAVPHAQASEHVQFLVKACPAALKDPCHIPETRGLLSSELPFRGGIIKTSTSRLLAACHLADGMSLPDMLVQKMQAIWCTSSRVHLLS